MNTFTPDIIVEVTGACNRACVGCYAPNVVAKEASDVFKKRPELFLKTSTLNDTLNEFPFKIGIASIRGGEPTLHPEIEALLALTAGRAEQVFLETHGRWLMAENFIPYMGLLETIKAYGIKIKISFDKMHGLGPDELKGILHFLNWHDVDYRIAITESSLAEYVETRSQCSWVNDAKIIFQQKAISEDELVKPLLGTINVRGEVKRTVTHKFIEASSAKVAYA